MQRIPMSRDRRRLKRHALALVVASAAALAGCSAGDVELNGKLFDAVGATGLIGKPSGKVQMAERSPLVAPPSSERLPVPGAALPESADVTKQVVDPERKKVISQAELQRQQTEYCKVHYEQAKMRGDTNADTATGPAGLCRPSALTAFQNWNKGEPEPEPTETAASGAVTPDATGSIGTVSEMPAAASTASKTSKKRTTAQ